MEPLTTRELLPVTLAHVTAVLLPVLGPLAMLALVRNERWARRHATFAVVASALWLGMAFLLDPSSASGDEGATRSTTAIFIALLVAMMAVAVINIGRAKQHRPPFGLPS